MQRVNIAYEKQDFDPPEIYIDDNVYERVSTTSKVVHTISDSYDYQIREVVSGFDAQEVFFRITAISKTENPANPEEEYITGFLLKRDELT